jgi:peptide/nickel transport system substrate-binding protein
MRSLAGALALLATQAVAQPHDLVIGTTQFPATLHPAIERVVAKSYIHGMVFRPITAHGPDWKPACMMCASFPTLENGQAVRQTTPDGKPGIRVTYSWPETWVWGDGTPVSAEDLVFTYTAARDPATGMGPAEFYRSLYRIDIDGPRQVTLHFDKVTFDFASITDFAPLPAHLERAIWQQGAREYRTRSRYDTETTNPGLWNGPYRISAVSPGASVTMEANPRWAGQAPGFRRITVRTVENTPALEAQLLSGGVDMVAGELGLPLDQALALEKRAGQRFTFHYQPGLVYEHIDLLLTNPILADVRVRRALLHGADREQISQRLFEGRQPVAHSSVNPLDWVHNPATPQHKHDPARARALLEEAGWRLATQGGGQDGIRRNAAGERLVLDFMTTAGNRSRELVQQVLQTQYKAIGIEIVVKNEPARVMFGESLRKRSYKGAVMFMSDPPMDYVPIYVFHSEWIPTAANNWTGQNYMGFRSAGMDEALDAAWAELDPARRKALWKRILDIAAEEVPEVNLFFGAQAIVTPKWITGVVQPDRFGSPTTWIEDWTAR